MSSRVCSVTGASVVAGAMSVILISSSAKIILYRTRWAASWKHAATTPNLTMSIPKPAQQLRYFRKQQSQIVESIRQLLDMKSGIALALHVMGALLEWGGGKLPRPVTLLFVSDEEIGSASSRGITERLARQSSAVLVLEPAYGLTGAVKTARKGVGGYTLEVTGKSAHSGLDFQKGQSAVLELAQQICEISKLIDWKRGITLNVGKVSGGTRVNVVPAEASAAVDLRVATRKDAVGMDRKLRAITP